jgi:hypothetical protein
MPYTAIAKPNEEGNALERLLTPQQIADAWQIDCNTVRRIFVDREGVLKLSFPRRGKRKYSTIRIPVSVVEQVRRERSK